LLVACLIFAWSVIIVSHLKFHRKMRRVGKQTRFKAIASPMSNYASLAFLAAIIIIMLLTPGIRVTAILMPVWLALVYAVYRATSSYRNQSLSQEERIRAAQ
jgi:aromatic amino acid transport protein AroP